MKAVRILCALLLLGCKSESSKLADLLDRSSSWLAAAAAVGQATVKNRTPVRYADDAFEDALGELGTAAAGLEELDLSPEIRADGKRLIESGRRTIGHLRAAIDAHAGDVSDDLQVLSARSDTLRDLGDKARKAGQ